MPYNLGMEHETFVLYYVCWHEGEFSLTEMRRLLVIEIGEDGLRIALAEFRKRRLERQQTGDFRTYYEVMNNGQNKIPTHDESPME